jgi:hypothetical protein
MMQDHDYYRRQAAEAEAQAKRARNPEDKAAWLRLARDWLSLLPQHARDREEQFDERVRAEGTHQNVSGREQ